MVGIRDVARKAGVSPTTVSRVLNKDETLSVTQETKQRVLRIAEELNYSVKNNSRAKKTSSSIGIITTVTEIDEIEDPYFRSIRIGIEKEAKEQKIAANRIYRLLDKEVQLEKIDQLGAIIVLGQVPKKLLETIYETNKNLIVVDDSSASQCYDAVYVDLAGLTYQLLDNLKRAGHSKIAFIGGFRIVRDALGNEDISKEDNRLLAYKKWMENENLDYENKVFLGDWTTLEGLKLSNELIETFEEKERPTAILVASDPMAVGVYRSLQKKGIRIPDDISIVSFDNIKMVEYLTPPLTTINIYTEELGRVAVRMAKERIVGAREIPLRTIVPGKIINRESVKKIT
jgi:LacI family transcriptional regulator